MVRTAQWKVKTRGKDEAVSVVNGKEKKNKRIFARIGAKTFETIA
jgi:hypothetical protein